MHDGAPYIVSELLVGQTLRERLLDGLVPQPGDRLRRQIAQGLMAAHEKRIVHRDLKPENLFITKDDRVKILDFGIAKLLTFQFGSEPGKAGPIEALTTQTKIGSVLGTISYMSPEQLRGKAVDHRSDIFSFGAIFYEMLTGRRAFAGDSQVDTMSAILKEDPPEMVRDGREIPHAIEQVVRHCLEKDPDNRFQSARDLAFALSTLSSTTTGKQISSFRPRAKQRGWLVSVVAVVLFTAAAIFLVPSSSGSRAGLPPSNFRTRDCIQRPLHRRRTDRIVWSVVERASAASLFDNPRFLAGPPAGFTFGLSFRCFAEQ